jgi:hypothetical protein
MDYMYSLANRVLCAIVHHGAMQVAALLVDCGNLKDIMTTRRYIAESARGACPIADHDMVGVLD